MIRWTSKKKGGQETMQGRRRNDEGMRRCGGEDIRDCFLSVAL